MSSAEYIVGWEEDFPKVDGGGERVHVLVSSGGAGRRHLSPAAWMHGWTLTRLWDRTDVQLVGLLLVLQQSTRGAIISVSFRAVDGGT